MGFDYFKIVYLGARGTEVVALCGVIGMVANFVRQTNQAQHQPPAAIMALLVSVSSTCPPIPASKTPRDGG